MNASRANPGDPTVRVSQPRRPRVPTETMLANNGTAESSTDTDSDFSPAEEALISDLVERANTAVREDGLAPHDVATILRATADCVDDPAHATDGGVLARLRLRLASAGSYLPTGVGGGER